MRETENTLPPTESPVWYRQSDIECIEAIRASMSKEMYEGFLQGNVIKYLWRWRHKGGEDDLGKALNYLCWLIGEADDADMPGLRKKV